MLPGYFAVVAVPGECTSTIAVATARALSHSRYMFWVAGSDVASSVAFSVRSTFKMAGSTAPAD